MQSFLILLPVLCVLLCVILILGIVVSFISTQAERAIVLEDKSILDGFRRGWEVLTKNLGPILIIWLITAAIGVVAAIVIALPLLVVLVPLVIAFIANMNNAELFLHAVDRCVRMHHLRLHSHLMVCQRNRDDLFAIGMDVDLYPHHQTKTGRTSAGYFTDQCVNFLLRYSA